MPIFARKPIQVFAVRLAQAVTIQQANGRPSSGDPGDILIVYPDGALEIARADRFATLHTPQDPEAEAMFPADRAEK